MLKKFFRYAGISIAVLMVLGFAWLEYSTNKNEAVPGELAMAAMTSNEFVDIQDGDWLVMKPKIGKVTTGLIIYPGANCNIKGYAPLMREIAAKGYLVVGMPMPYNFAFLAPASAAKAPKSFPEIKNWFLAGHSLGGAMASTFAASNEDMLSGLIMWDSYPALSLADSALPITSIFRATLEGEQPENFKDFVNFYPPDATWVPVPGGIHMYFGSFIGGSYKELWKPKISIRQQHQIVIDATLNAIKSAISSE